MGLCGACTVLQNGKAIRSCQKQMGSVAGLTFTTIEGVSAQGPHALQKAWAEVNVPQCGYCQTGQIMQAVSLLSTKSNSSDADIATVMAGNICRC
jgi:isoquinoline 1-oxidoreductase alpha subunit